MVVKPFSHLARQSFGKTFTHGYAQSVVAATQSSYASSNTPLGPFSPYNSNRFGRPGTSQVHSSFQNVPSLTGLAGKVGTGQQQGAENGDHGLNAYFEAWQRQQLLHGGDKEWRQYQFAKRIGWKPSAAPAADDKVAEEVEHDFQTTTTHPVELERSYSTSALDDLKKREDVVAESRAIAQVDEAIADEIASFRREQASNDPSESASSGVLSTDQTKALSPQWSQLSIQESSNTESVGDVAVAKDANSFSKHIAELYTQGAFAQIPAVFQSLLVEGFQPTARDYNALLAAAINSSRIPHQVIPKALDVYANMLQRGVRPDAHFYSALIGLLSTRALEVHDRTARIQQKLKRFGSLESDGSLMLGSQEAERAILVEDDALKNAINIFHRSLEGNGQGLSADTYHLLVTACALHGHLESMVQAYNRMEAHFVRPHTDMFPIMISAFAQSGDLNSAVECYNEYRTMAMQNDAGETTMLARKDNDVYAAVVKAYAHCGKEDGGSRFASRIVQSFDKVTEHRQERLASVHDAIGLGALVKSKLEAGDVGAALKVAEECNLTLEARQLAMLQICIAAADASNLDVASKAYQYLPNLKSAGKEASLALISLHIRSGDLGPAAELWSMLKTDECLDSTSVDLAVFYATTLIRNGRVDEAFSEARSAFAQMRANAVIAVPQDGLSDQVDEAIEVIANSVFTAGIVPDPNTSMQLLWAMIENGGLTASAERILASLGPNEILSLSWPDIVLTLQVEAGLVGGEQTSLDAAHPARFAHLLSICMQEGVHFDSRSLQLINRAVSNLSTSFPDLSAQWNSHRQALDQGRTSAFSFATVGSPEFSTTDKSRDADPYAASTDFKGSAIIVEELENRRNSSGLSDALSRFRNIRRSGRHPRFLAYAKLIAAAAKEGRSNLTYDILGMARKDVPFVAGNTLVLQGWISILDAMLGACLTAGRRSAAEQFHHELLEIGAAPTANTFGLYITTLKSSTRTFDEASEAVSIFNRALNEGVVPSSFLYNALIGKLGKARRIDDCLRYFQEMRSAGIRPTSVTYGTVVNALCRVSDERFAEELFDEMESMPNYKPRPAPYNSLMQFFLTTKRDGSKVLAYYDRMRSKNIQPTMHTYKLLIDTHATLEPINLTAAEGVLEAIRATGQKPEAVHYASLIHAKGCALHDMAGARQVFDDALRSRDFPPSACLYQALFESMVANHCASDTELILDSMSANHVEMTPYIANTLIHGWANENKIAKARAIFDSVSIEQREPSTYEAMTRALLTAEDREGALAVVHEMLSRGYPSAVSNKILELVGHHGRAGANPTNGADA